MTELRIEKVIIPSAEFNGVNPLPAIFDKIGLHKMNKSFLLHEDDGLFLNYGTVDYVFPYKVQDQYTRELNDKEQTLIVLENDHLKATFFPQFGGKLNSLYDKDAQKELLYVNSVVRPCNLATRNAWMSGGVEWNCGFFGHSPFTCDWVHTAKTKLDDGTPVLRFYQYERVRCVVYQIDFFLPEDSRFLYVRTRITNPNYEVTPIYWWSNIAVPDNEGNRVITPTETTYTAKGPSPVKIAVPVYNGIDFTYPLNNVIAIDYFWNIPDKKRKFICQVDKDGYGLVQTSTDRLKGRKLFVWGNTKGGARWKNFLTSDNESGSYNEIQAGLAKTQYECLPLPPKTVWEWVEAYGAIQTDPNKVHGSWDDAKTEATDRLNDLITEEYLEELLVSTKKMAKTKAKKVLFFADGWGALEQKRRNKAEGYAMCEHLDFGEIQDEQSPWDSLLNEGSIGIHDPSVPPVSYMRQREWKTILEDATKNKDKDNWFAWLQLGLINFIEKNYKDAQNNLEKSLSIQKSAWALYTLFVVFRDQDKLKEGIKYLTEAHALLPTNASLTKETLRWLFADKQYETLINIYNGLIPSLKSNPRFRTHYAYALFYTGDVEGAEKLLYENGGIVIPDLREAETTTYNLWKDIQIAKNLPTDNPPHFLEFRMSANSKWLSEGQIL